MFDYRYHALSLAAVLLALALGVLLGVAIGDSNLVSSAKKGVVRNLQADLGSAQQRISTLESEQHLERAAQNDLYQTAVRDVLSTHKIGLVFLGGSSERINSLVRSAVNQAGGDVSSVIAVREPLNLEGLAHESAGTRYQALDQTPEPRGLLKEFGVRVGDQFVKGGRLLGHVQGSLLSSFDGLFGELEGLVVVRADPEHLSSEEAKSTAEFQSGFITGASAAGASSVGVELSTTEPSQIPWYKSQSISSVDDLDKLSGRAALVLALAGAHGSWGTKPTADGPLPTPLGTIAQP